MMGPVNCRFAGELMVVRHHRIHRNLSDVMLEGCVAEVMVSEYPHGQDERIIKWDLPLKMPPHGVFQPKPHRHGQTPRSGKSRF